jgi:phosphatidylserine synthase
MPRLTLAELEVRCQKPDFRTSGNWMARRISRPLALRMTWVIAPWRISANTVTSLALLLALAAAACFAWGRPAGWLAGAALLQLWYLLDHVDGQVARLHGASSLDGIQFDYLMHHLVNLIIPSGLGYGMWRASGAEYWLPVGFAFAVGTLVLGLVNDTRYKAFFARLKEVDGQLVVGSDAGNTAEVVPSTPFWRSLQKCVHLARKLCEVHVVMNFTTALAVVQVVTGSPLPIKIYLVVMAPLALATSIATVARDIGRGATEREFARWYVPQATQRRSSPSARVAGEPERDGIT